MTSKIRFTLLRLVLVLGLVFIGYSAGNAAPTEPTTSTEPKSGGTLKIFTNITIDENMGWPVELFWMHMHTTEYLTMEPLIRLIREDGTIEPMLATSWEIAPDLLSVTFYLREGVKFHDGTDFIADAVKFMVDSNIKAKTPASMNWKSCDIINDYTVRLNLNQFSNALWSDLASMNCMIVSPTAYEKNGIEWMKKNPVGTGPFTLVEFSTTEMRGRFEKNTDYWQEGKPYLDAIEYYSIADQVSLEMSFLAGEAHILTLQPAKTMSAMKKKGYDIVAPLLGIPFIAPDNDPDSPWSNKAVREAMEYALDKETMVKGMGYGIWEPVWQYAFPGTIAYDSDIEPREYNPDKAKQLLASAGYENGFSTKLITDPTRIDHALMVQQFLHQVGIEAKIEQLSNVALAELQRNGWSGLTIPSIGLAPNWASGTYSVFTSHASIIWPEGLKDILMAAMSTPDNDEMIKLNQQCNKLIIDEAAIIPLYADSLGFILSPKVHDGGWLTHGTSAVTWRPENTWLE